MVDYADPKMAGYAPLSEFEDNARERSSRVINPQLPGRVIPFVGAAYRYYKVTFRQSLFQTGPLDMCLTDFALETISGVGMAGYTVNRGGWAIPSSYAAWYNGDDTDTLIAVDIVGEGTFVFDFGVIRSISNLRLVAKDPGTLGSNPQKFYPKHAAVAGSEDGVHWVILDDGKGALLWSSANETKDIPVCGSAVGIRAGAGLTFFYDQVSRLLTITADASGEGTSSTAAAITSLAHGDLAATNVQDALNELQDEKLATAALSDIIETHIEALLDPAHTGMTEAVADRVFGLLQAGNNITLVYNDTTGELTINAAALGAVEPGPVSLDSLTDVVLAAPALNQVLRFDGVNWVNSNETPASAGGTISILDNGATVHAAATILNFSGLTLTSSGSEVTIAAEASTGGGISADDLGGNLAWFVSEPYRYWRIQITNQESAATDSVNLGLRALELQETSGTPGPVPVVQTGGMDEWFDGDPVTEGVMSWGGYAQTKLIDLDYGVPKSFANLMIIPTEDRDQDPWLIEILASTDNEIWNPVYEPEEQLSFVDETPVDYSFDMPRVATVYPLMTNPVGNTGKILAVNTEETGFELVPFKPLAIADVTDLGPALDNFDENLGVVFEQLGTKLADAPVDGSTYGRKDAAWVEIPEPESPLPALVGNAGKVLKVNVGETAAEWAVDLEGTGGGGGSGTAATTTFTPAGDLTATDVQAALEELDNEKAPKASPALTGTPTAPTAAVATNTTQVATTAFVRAELAALIASSPASLDTLNELATALGNDPNFATTMTAALAAKAPLNDPAFTGTPTGITKAHVGLASVDNTPDTGKPVSTAQQAALDTKIGFSATVTDATTARTLGLTDINKYIRMTNAAANVVTIPTNATAAFPIDTEIVIRQAGAGQTTITAAAGVTLNPTITKTRAQNSPLVLKKVGTNEWDATGDLE